MSPEIKHGPGRTGLTRAANHGSLMVPHSWDPALALTQHRTVPAQPGTGMPHFERERKREKLLRCGGSCWESTEAVWGISALSGDHPLLQSLLGLSALQARKVSHIPGSCPKRWKVVAEERAVSGGLALGALSQGKAHTQSMEHRQRLLQPGNNTVHPPAAPGPGAGRSRGNKVWKVISRDPLNRE